LILRGEFGPSSGKRLKRHDCKRLRNKKRETKELRSKQRQHHLNKEAHPLKMLKLLFKRKLPLENLIAF
jgi:allophanate hydrolase subunit 2